MGQLARSELAPTRRQEGGRGADYCDQSDQGVRHRMWKRRPAGHVSREKSGLAESSPLPGSTYSQKTPAFQIEDFATCQVDTMDLRILIRNEDAGNAYADDILLYPTVNFVSVHGHNIAPAVTPEFRSSTDNFSGSDDLEATLTLSRPSFYGYLSTPQTRRYYQLDLNGTNVETSWIGELVLGYVETLTRSPETIRQAWVQTYLRDSVRTRTPGEPYVTNIGGGRRRVLGLPFILGAEAELLEIRDEILDRTNHGARPLVIVPLSSESAVVPGRVTEDALRVERDPSQASTSSRSRSRRAPSRRCSASGRLGW